MVTVATFTSSNPACVFCTVVSCVVERRGDRSHLIRPVPSTALACSAVLMLASSAVRAAFNCVAVGSAGTQLADDGAQRVEHAGCAGAEDRWSGHGEGGRLT